VFRSSTICEIETFITLESSTMMNWADARMINGSHLRTRRLYAIESPKPHGRSRKPTPA
jgi:heme/copper-type cytochrome/quinol oxidase subunit 3